MAFLLRTIIITFLVVYTTYLFTYKCAQLNESVLQHEAETIFHPLTHHHNKLCDGLNAGVAFVTPYVEKAHGFLDEHVHSNKYFIEYEVKEKFLCAKSQYYKFVYPYVIQFFEYFEIAEVHVYDHFAHLYELAKAYYYSTVSPKIVELKQTYF